MYKKLEVKSALHWLEPPRFTPYQCDMNPYRGCQHKCEYCFALYTHKFLNSDNFYEDIFYKENLLEWLEKDLKKKKFKNQLIGVGTVCDAYQPIEEKLNLTGRTLDIFIKHKTPIYLSTKSKLILRDIDKIAELSKVSTVYIALSIITLDENISSKLEPNVISPEERFEVARILKEKTNAYVGIHLMPIIPALTDSRKNIYEIMKRAKGYGLDFVHAFPLNLYTETRIHFFNFLKTNFPNEVDYISRCYQTNKNIKEYQSHCHNLVMSIKKELHFFNKSNTHEWEKKQDKQLSIFDE